MLAFKLLHNYMQKQTHLLNYNLSMRQINSNKIKKVKNNMYIKFISLINHKVISLVTTPKKADNYQVKRIESEVLNLHNFQKTNKSKNLLKNQIYMK